MFRRFIAHLGTFRCYVRCFIVFSSNGSIQRRCDPAPQKAYALQEKARSNEDLKKAVQKYEYVLAIYARAGDSKTQVWHTTVLG